MGSRLMIILGGLHRGVLILAGFAIFMLIGAVGSQGNRLS